MKQHKIDHKSTHKEINQYKTTLTNTINENIKENIKKITIQPNKIGLPPFIRELIKEKRKTRKLYQQSRRQHYKTEYNRLNKQIKILIKQEQRKHWENKCNDLELKENQNNTWKQMKSMLGLKPVKTKYPTLITLDNNNKKIKSTTTTQKIQTLTDTFKNTFTYDNTKPYFDNKHKTHTETELTNHVDKTSTLKAIPLNYKNSEYAITKKDRKHY